MRFTKKQFNNFTTSQKWDIVIGVDPSGAKPGVNKNGSFKPGTIGLCIATSRTQIDYFDSVNFFKFQTIVSEYINKIHPDKVFGAVVEQPDGQSAFRRRGINNNKMVGKQNRDLGKNQLMSNLICAWLKHLGADVIEKTPKEKGAKWKEPLFRLRSNYKEEIKKRQSHAIDGYQLIYPYLRSA